MLPKITMRKTGIFVLALIVCLGFGPLSYAYLVMPASYGFTRQGDTGYISSYGTYSYTDSSKTKLTDGIIGQDDWTQNRDFNNWVGWWGISYQGDVDGDGEISKGDYIDNPVTITFNFEQNFKLSAINLWTNQDAINNFNVVYPGEISVTRNDSVLATLTTTFSKERSGEGGKFNKGKLHEISFGLGDIDIHSGDAISITLSNWDIFNSLRFNGNNWEYAGIQWNNSPGSTYNGMFWIFLSEVQFVSPDSPNPVPIPGTIVLFGSGFLFLVGITRRRIRP